MSIAEEDTIEALPDPVSTIEMAVLSKIKGGALVPPKSTGARSMRSCSFSRSQQELQELEL